MQLSGEILIYINSVSASAVMLAAVKVYKVALKIDRRLLQHDQMYFDFCERKGLPYDGPLRKLKSRIATGGIDG